VAGECDLARRFMEGLERERQPSAERLAAWKAGLNGFSRQATRPSEAGSARWAGRRRHQGRQGTGWLKPWCRTSRS
jgi:hypothetical protein